MEPNFLLGSTLINGMHQHRGYTKRSFCDELISLLYVKNSVGLSYRRDLWNYKSEFEQEFAEILYDTAGFIFN